MEFRNYGQLLLDFIDEQYEAERPLQALPTLPAGASRLTGYQVKATGDAFRLWLVYALKDQVHELRWKKAGLFCKELEARVVGHYLVQVAKVNQAGGSTPNPENGLPTN